MIFENNPSPPCHTTHHNTSLQHYTVLQHQITTIFLDAVLHWHWFWLDGNCVLSVYFDNWVLFCLCWVFFFFRHLKALRYSYTLVLSQTLVRAAFVVLRLLKFLPFVHISMTHFIWNQMSFHIWTRIGFAIRLLNDIWALEVFVYFFQVDWKCSDLIGLGPMFSSVHIFLWCSAFLYFISHGFCLLFWYC